MSLLTRVTDFVPSTLIKSQEVDDELNQLVNLLSGVSTTKDTLLKFSDGSNPVLRVDQLGAGVIQQWLQNGAVKTLIDNSGHLYIGEGVTDATPAVGRINGTGGSGTNIAGANLQLVGGKGTGTGVPGRPVILFPLIGASGSTLQSLSSGSYPPPVSVYTNTTTGTAIANTTTETSIFSTPTASAESTTSIEGGISRLGTHYRVRAVGNIATTGTPTFQIKVKLGGTTIADTTASGITTAGGKFWLDVDMVVNTLGAAGTVTAFIRFDFSSANSGGVTIGTLNGANTGITVDTTGALTLDVTFQWGTASASNTVTVFILNVDRLR